MVEAQTIMEKDNRSTLEDIMEHYSKNIPCVQYNQNSTDALHLNISYGELYQTYIASKDEKLIAMVYFICRLIESGLAIIGNLLTIIICVRVKKMQTTTNLLITSLAIGDLLSGLDTPFYMVAEMHQDDPSGYLYCIIAEYVDLLGGFGNTFSITCLALDRMVAIQYPVQYMRCPKKRLLMGQVVMWAYIASFLAFIFAFGQVEEFKYPICFFKSNLTSWAHDGVIYGHVSVLSLLTVIFYMKVWRALSVRNAKAIRHGGLGGGQSVAAKRRLHRRVMRMLGLIVCVYFTLALPITVGSFCGLLAQDMSPFQHAAFRVCWAIWYMNSFINPLLYVWSNSSFREALCLHVECVIGRRREDLACTGRMVQYPQFVMIDRPSSQRVIDCTHSRLPSSTV